MYKATVIIAAAAWVILTLFDFEVGLGFLAAVVFVDMYERAK